MLWPPHLHNVALTIDAPELRPSRFPVPRSFGKNLENVPCHFGKTPQNVGVEEITLQKKPLASENDQTRGRAVLAVHCWESLYHVSSSSLEPRGKILSPEVPIRGYLPVACLGNPIPQSHGDTPERPCQPQETLDRLRIETDSRSFDQDLHSLLVGHGPFIGTGTPQGVADIHHRESVPAHLEALSAASSPPVLADITLSQGTFQTSSHRHRGKALQFSQKILRETSPVMPHQRPRERPWRELRPPRVGMSPTCGPCGPSRTPAGAPRRCGRCPGPRGPPRQWHGSAGR